MDKHTLTRRLAQLYSALLYNAHLRGFVEGGIYQGGAKAACAPGLNCYSCPGATAACPLGALQNALGSAGHRAGWYILGILLLYGVILGRTVCGWLCPAGLLQELAHGIPTPKLGKSRATRALSWLKYAVLAVFAVAIPLIVGLRDGVALPAFCKFICPAGTLEGGVGLLANPANESMLGMLGPLFTRKFVILAAVGLACVFCYRAFCRFLCPLGAIYSLFSRFNVVGARVDAGRCNGCGACARACRMDVRRVGDRECIHCAECVALCPQGAISFGVGGATLIGPKGEGRKARRAVRIAALALLALALVWFNALDPALKKPAAPSYESDAPVGFEVGDQLADFTVRCLDGSEFALSEARGKAVFINLWATWCGPCVAELPSFAALADAHAGEVAVLVVHSPLVTDDPAAFLAAQDWAAGAEGMAFALDADEAVWPLVNGGAALPQTIVLNRRGEVVYNRQGPLTDAALEALFAQATE